MHAYAEARLLAMLVLPCPKLSLASTPFSSIGKVSFCVHGDRRDS